MQDPMNTPNAGRCITVETVTVPEHIKRGIRLGLTKYNMRHIIPYPLRATKFSLDFNPFGFWWCPDFHYRKNLTEFAKVEGEKVWWFRWLWFQISYSRWV